MYMKIKKNSTLQTTQMVCGKDDDYSSSDGDCMTRMMTPEDWEKYGPLMNTREIIQKQKAV